MDKYYFDISDDTTKYQKCSNPIEMSVGTIYKLSNLSKKNKLDIFNESTPSTMYIKFSDINVIKITECVDEWFLVDITYNEKIIRNFNLEYSIHSNISIDMETKVPFQWKYTEQKMYICDQFEGLLQLLIDKEIINKI